MTDPDIVSRDEWLVARRKLLAREKELTRELDALAAERRALPVVRVGKAYTFRSPDGPCTLGDLFGPHDQLVIYHFMFGPDWEDGCPSCSFWADGYDGIDVHLAARGTALAAVSNAPIETLEAYRKRMGWRFRWVSAGESGFSEDFGVTFREGGDYPQGYNYTGSRPDHEELPGVSVFLRLADGTVGHSYSTYGRGLDILNPAYRLLDLTPKGRDEGGLPWPMAWVRRHDEY